MTAYPQDGTTQQQKEQIADTRTHDEAPKHRRRESRQTQPHTARLHLRHSGKGNTLGTRTSLSRLPGTGSDYNGAQGTFWGDRKTLYLGCGGGYMTASESCTPKRVNFTMYNVDLNKSDLTSNKTRDWGAQGDDGWTRFRPILIPNLLLKQRYDPSKPGSLSAAVCPHRAAMSIEWAPGIL